jgi:copper resistance protein C
MSGRPAVRRLTGVLLAVVAAVLAVATAAVPASAHAELVSTDPRDGTTVQGMPSTVTLTFSEQVRTPAFVEVTGPGGNVAAGDPRIVDDQITQRVDADADAGSYEVSYRITSADGHPVGGIVGFTLAGAGQGQGGGGDQTTPPAAENPQAGETEESGMSTGQLVLLLGVLAVGLAAVAVGTRRALRHSVAMVDDKRGGRSSSRR